MPPRKRTDYSKAAGQTPAAPTAEKASPSTAGVLTIAATPGSETGRGRKTTAAKKAAARRTRTAPVRVTLDLSPADHQALKKWCNVAAVETDLPSVALAPVLRLLGAELITNKDLSRQIMDRLVELADEDMT